MIKQVTIRNFRCYQNLQVGDLKKINLIVGRNSSGKSTFMEAIFLSSSPAAPNVALQLRAIRRMGNQIQITNEGQLQAYRALWEDLFYDFKDTEKVSIKMAGEPVADEHSLTVEYLAKSSQVVPIGKQTPASGSMPSVGMPQIAFTWKRQGHPVFVAKPKLVANGIQYDSAELGFFPCLWFTPGVAEGPDETAKRFSEIDKRGGTSKIQAALFAQFPFIQGLSIQYLSGTPMIFAQVEGRSKKMPLNLISDGVTRLLSILVGIAFYEGGTVLIDQLEDGFHYTLLPSIWASIYAFAVEFNVQVFISTHSQECLRAVVPVIKGHEDDFRLLMASRKSEKHSIKSVSGEYLESALEQEFEVR